MERKAFLRSLGAEAAFALTFPCLQGCSSDSGPDEGEEIPTGVDFTIDRAARTVRTFKTMEISSFEMT